MAIKFGPKIANHPSVGLLCPACQNPFKEGEYTALIPLGPGNDPDEQEKAKARRAYNTVAVEVHWDCSYSAYEAEDE